MESKKLNDCDAYIQLVALNLSEEMRQIIEFIDPLKMTRAVNSFGPLKSGGLDNFRPILLQMVNNNYTSKLTRDSPRYNKNRTHPAGNRKKWLCGILRIPGWSADHTVQLPPEGAGEDRAVVSAGKGHPANTSLPTCIHQRAVLWDGTEYNYQWQKDLFMEVKCAWSQFGLLRSIWQDQIWLCKCSYGANAGATAVKLTAVKFSYSVQWALNAKRQDILSVKRWTAKCSNLFSSSSKKLFTAFGSD